MKGWVGLVGRAQDGEKTLARDWRSTAEPRIDNMADLRRW